jgi:predicted N-formylglutamate amidohydrolase
MAKEQPVRQLVRDAYEVYGDPKHINQLVITCEHASNRVPEPLSTSVDDQSAISDHWGYDLGAEAVARELVHLKGCCAVLARFSRLVIDANRPPDHGELIRRRVEGHALSFNDGITDAEVQRRIDTYHDPYHRAIDTLCADRLAALSDVVLFSIHSFTPQLGDDVRGMELGVLFDKYDAIAGRLAGNLDDQGFKVALNQPYSGRTGLIFAAHRHGTAHGCIYLELEIRQDLVATPEAAREVARRIEPALTKLQVRSQGRS